MDRFRYQTWKNSDEVLRYVGGTANNYVDGVEQIPINRTVQLVLGEILDLYQVDGELVAIITFNDCIYQVAVDNVNLNVEEQVSDTITFNTNLEKWFSY